MELYHGTMEKFEKFDPNFTCDMGFHFGTFSSAAARVGNIKNIPGSQKPVIFKVEVKKTNFFRLPDCGDWSDHQLVSEFILDTQSDKDLLAIAQKYVDKPYKFLGRQPHEDMRDELINAGWDGIIYSNFAEKGGDSVLVFESENVAIIGEA